MARKINWRGDPEVREVWNITTRFDRDLDFCVWLLKYDGLQVPPFVLHPDGNGSLRALGLDSGSWRRWLRRVFAELDAAERELNAAIMAWNDRERAPLFRRMPSEVPNEVIERAKRIAQLEPPLLWTGASALRNRLDELWELYNSIANERQQREERANGASAPLWPRGSTPPERVRLMWTEYPAYVEYLFPPSAALVSVGEWMRNEETYDRHIIEMARRVM